MDIESDAAQQNGADIAAAVVRPVEREAYILLMDRHPFNHEHGEGGTHFWPPPPTPKRVSPHPPHVFWLRPVKALAFCVIFHALFGMQKLGS